ncbi:MAG: FAD-dependent oxidoreductase, partial [Mameliella sp.]|nr:FAD-dependent oxidoreductase [Phaeodactylibacter sp.]
MYRLLISFFVFISFWQNELLAQKQEGVFLTTYKADVCVYGATGSGIIAAIAAARAGKSVIVIEPCHEIGGLLKSGFRMQQDTPFGDHLGSLTKVFYTKDLMQPKPRHKQGAGHYNVKSLYEMIAPYKERIKIIKDHRVSDVKMSGKKIVAATFEYAPLGKYGVPLAARASDNLTIVTSDVYIDSSYEGDLMAKTGVSYRIGKEGVSEYNESMAGVTLGKKFPGVDPYKIEGDPSSGLLSCISPEPLGEIGSE